MANCGDQKGVVRVHSQRTFEVFNPLLEPVLKKNQRYASNVLGEREIRVATVSGFNGLVGKGDALLARVPELLQHIHRPSMTDENYRAGGHPGFRVDEGKKV
jgi:hypothetical protein